MYMYMYMYTYMYMYMHIYVSIHLWLASVFISQDGLAKQPLGDDIAMVSAALKAGFGGRWNGSGWFISNKNWDLPNSTMQN